ncbi:MAG: S53 family serine peptidase [Acidobacteriia bacterium]|nr:S53 family serine peptidase [Terriglobia bacterium]
MIRRLSLFLLTIAAMVSCMNMVCQAQEQAALTNHMRDVTLNGQARSVGRLPATHSMRLDIVLPLRNQAELDNFLQELYDPSSPSYRRFLTVQEFTARFGPSQKDYDAVIRFAKRNGFTVVGGSRDGMDVQLKGLVATIEKAFHVAMGVYQHPTENRTFYAPDREPTVDLPFQLWHISGLDNYSIPHPALLHRDERNLIVQPNFVKGSCPSGSYCGSDMRAAYYGGTALTGTGQTLGLVEYYGYDQADVNTYFTNAGQTNSVPIKGISTDGTSLSCFTPGCDDTEQILDITQAVSMAPGMTALNVYVGSSDTAILSSMSTHLSNGKLDAQLSSSWTWSPSDPGTDDPYFKKFAAQGQNFFQAAGDSRAYTPSSTYVYPADDAYVTVVGGTDLQTSSAGGAWSSETIWSYGGGGYFTPDAIPIPSWQQLAGVITPTNQGSTTLRNSPDVAAESNFDFYVCADQTTCTANYYGGTSFAAPMWAGYMALVNQQAVANGNSPLGFINPIIYTLGLGSSYGTDFHDITSGSNGYSAVTGYDLATGWGSPNGTGLINALAGISSSPDFTISGSPSSVSVVQGNKGTSTITTVVSGGFNSAIALSATGQPSGVTVSFSPTPIAAPGSGSSTMNITVASTTATGTYPITVTGTGGSTTHATTVTLMVAAAASADFTISASPTQITVARNHSGTSTITRVALNGFSSAITLSASGQGSSQNVSFGPNPIAASGSGTSTMTVTVGRRARVGAYTITITGTGGGKTHTTTVTLNVQ